jgi:hypothetical protein
MSEKTKPLSSIRKPLSYYWVKPKNTRQWQIGFYASDIIGWLMINISSSKFEFKDDYFMEINETPILKPLSSDNIKEVIKTHIEPNIIQSDVDYKELLKKYTEHVRQCEGIDFIDRINSFESDVKFTEDEVKSLQSIHKPL